MRAHMKLSERVMLAIVTLLIVGMPTTLRAQSSETSSIKLPAQYAATAVGTSGSTAGKTLGLNIYVNDVTTDAEASELAATLRKSGPNGLLKALGKTKDKGRFSPTGTVGTGIRMVRVKPTPTGTRIIMVTDRPISFFELYNSTRSRDYPFGVATLNLDKDEKGTGSLAPACKIKFNKKGELEIEHYGQKPARLTNVYRQK